MEFDFFFQFFEIIDLSFAPKNRVNYGFSQSHEQHVEYIKIYIEKIKECIRRTDSRYLGRFSAGARGFLRRILAGGRRNRRIIRRRCFAGFTFRTGRNHRVGALQSAAGGIFVLIRKHQASSEIGGVVVEASDRVRIVVFGPEIPTELAENRRVVLAAAAAAVVVGEEIHVVRVVRTEWPAGVAGELGSWIGFVTFFHQIVTQNFEFSVANSAQICRRKWVRERESESVREKEARVLELVVFVARWKGLVVFELLEGFESFVSSLHSHRERERERDWERENSGKENKRER